MDMTKVHELWAWMLNNGATKEDCIEIMKIGFETVDKIIDKMNAMDESERR